MDHTTMIINRILPILLLIGLGYWIRARRFLAESTVEDLRKIAVNLALPSVLFVSFLQIDFQPAYAVLFVVLFGLCIGLYALGVVLKERLGVGRSYFPFLMTGFEYGMLGVSLFGSAYGLDNVGFIAVTDLGHEIFIWFVFLALLLIKRDGLQSRRELVGSFFKSPVIIAILSGIALNLLGAEAFLNESPLTGGVLATLQFLTGLTVPLILIIVGYGIHFDRHGLREAALVVGIRLVILVPLALVVSTVLVRGLLHLEKGFEIALFTLLILPPPFIIPLYMPPEPSQEREYVNNVLTLYTVISIAIFALYFIANPQL